MSPRPDRRPAGAPRRGARTGALAVAVPVALVALLVGIALVRSSSEAVEEASVPTGDHPAGRIVLRAYAPDGRLMNWTEFRRVQAGTSRGGDPEDGADDVLLDARTLRVVEAWPLGRTAAGITLHRPAGAVALGLAWPSSAGYSALILDLPAPGTYVLNHLAARQAVSDLDRAVRARPDYAPGASFLAAARTARTELAAADGAATEAARAGHGNRAYDAAVRAQLTLLTEYGPRHAASRPAARRPVWGATLDSPRAASAALGAVTAMGAGTGRAAVRLVFEAGRPPEDYAPAVAAAHRAGLSVVGQLLDSSELASMPLARWRERVERYVAALPEVDTWEVGNEVNGNWVGDGVAEKVAFAASWVKGRTSARTLLTLYWQLGEDDAEHSVFTWAARHLPAATTARLDEIGLSVYPENAPLGVAFDRVFRTLHAAFPRQELSVTELGYGSADLDRRWWWGHPTDWTGAGRLAVADLYGRAVPGYPYSAGGTYWWYFQDEAPRDSPLWRTFAAIRADCSRG